MQIQAEKKTTHLSLEELAILHFIKEENNLTLQSKFLGYLSSLKIFKGLTDGSLQFKIPQEVDKLVRKKFITKRKDGSTFVCQMAISNEVYENLMKEENPILKESINNIMHTSLSNKATLAEMLKVITVANEPQQLEEDLKGQRTYIPCLRTVLTSHPHIELEALVDLAASEIEKFNSTSLNQIKRNCSKQIKKLIARGEIVVTNKLLSLKTNGSEKKRQNEQQLEESATTILSTLKRTRLSFDKPYEEATTSTSMTHSTPATQNLNNNLQVVTIADNSARFTYDNENHRSQQSRDESIDTDKNDNNSSNNAAKSVTERMSIASLLN